MSKKEKEITDTKKKKEQSMETVLEQAQMLNLQDLKSAILNMFKEL